MAISGKVTASTVAAATSTMVLSILARHVSHGAVPSDVRGLVEAGVTAGVTFVSGYLARHGIDADAVAHDVEALAEDFGVPFLQVPDVADDAPAVEPLDAVEDVPADAPATPAV